MSPAAANGEPASLKELGNDAFKRGDLEEALKLYSQAIEVSDKSQVSTH